MPANERIDTKTLRNAVIRVDQDLEAQNDPVYKRTTDYDDDGNSIVRIMPNNLQIPNHLLCPLSGTLMLNPTMIDSGVTFERSIIKRYLDIKTETARQF